jgi:hypothetical protein
MADTIYHIRIKKEFAALQQILEPKAQVVSQVVVSPVIYFVNAL